MSQEPNSPEIEDLNFLSQHVGLVDSEINNWIRINPDRDAALREDTSLNSSQYKEITLKDALDRQQLIHEDQNQLVRLKNLRQLFYLTVAWVVFIWIILILQGFGGYPFQQTSAIYNFLVFKLSDGVIIAFMTTTTATVLGLYTIAAIWLYKGSKEDKKTEVKPTEEQSTEE